MSTRKRWTREKIVERLRDCDEPPTARDLQVPGDESLPSYLTVHREFGTLGAALEEAGWPGRGKRGRPKKVTA